MDGSCVGAERLAEPRFSWLVRELSRTIVDYECSTKFARKTLDRRRLYASNLCNNVERNKRSKDRECSTYSVDGISLKRSCYVPRSCTRFVQQTLDCVLNGQGFRAKAVEHRVRISGGVQCDSLKPRIGGGQSVKRECCCIGSGPIAASKMRGRLSLIELWQNEAKCIWWRIKQSTAFRPCR